MSARSREQYVLARSCTDKRDYTVTEARAVVRRLRFGDSKITMYRCPFASDHTDPAKDWHIGHTPNLNTIKTLAAMIRARQGYPMSKPNDGPGPKP